LAGEFEIDRSGFGTPIAQITAPVVAIAPRSDEVGRYHHPFRKVSRIMKTTSGIIGLLLIVFGIVALAVPSVTFFTTERVADVGFFAIDMAKPHTIFFNPIVGVISLIAGIVLTVTATRAKSM
jgi:hypothetical protein